NEAEDRGGALFGVQCDVQATDCDFLENEAFIEGGGILIGGGTFQLENCRVQKNHIEVWSGAGIHASNAQCQLVSCQISDNLGDFLTDGGGAFFAGGSASIIECE